VLFGYAPILAGLALVVEGLAMVWVCGAASLAALTLGVISFREQRRYLDFVVALCNNREELALVDATPAPSLSAEWACWRRVLILSAVVFLVLFGLGLWAAKW
jgi:hypothetical protein